MRKIVYHIIVPLFAVVSCSQNNDLSDRMEEKWHSTYQGACGPVSDAIEYPSPWTKEVKENFIIPDETIRSMSSCGLLETWLANPDRMLGPWSAISSDLYVPGVTMFNNKLRNDAVVPELFARENCVSVLTAKYQSVIEQKAEQSGWQACFEMLLASDICMSVLNGEDRIQFMRMALEMADREKTHLTETRHIMVAVMQAENYTPFLTEAEKYYEFGDTQRSGLSEWLSGYDVCGFDVVEKYAKQFINEKTGKS